VNGCRRVGFRHPRPSAIWRRCGWPTEKWPAMLGSQIGNVQWNVPNEIQRELRDVRGRVNADQRRQRSYGVAWANLDRH
jgi:hypothetical protein